jgi:hypothetical protein
MCENGKMRPIETIPGGAGGRGVGGFEENDGGVNSTMICCCKNLCKCHNVPPIQQSYDNNNNKNLSSKTSGTDTFYDEFEKVPSPHKQKTED